MSIISNGRVALISGYHKGSKITAFGDRPVLRPLPLSVTSILFTYLVYLCPLETRFLMCNGASQDEFESSRWSLFAQK